MKKFGRNLLWMATAGVLVLGMVACGGKSTTGSSSGSKEEGSTQMEAIPAMTWSWQRKWQRDWI